MKERLLSDLDKLVLSQESIFVRFFIGAAHDPELAFKNLGAHLKWRRANNVNDLQNNEEVQDSKIYQFVPNTFWHADADGRPLWIVKAGRLNDLMAKLKVSSVLQFIVRELEHTILEKLTVTKGEQILLLIDCQNRDIEQSLLETLVKWI